MTIDFGEYKERVLELARGNFLNKGLGEQSESEDLDMVISLAHDFGYPPESAVWFATIPAKKLTVLINSFDNNITLIAEILSIVRDCQ